MPFLASQRLQGAWQLLLPIPEDSQGLWFGFSVAPKDLMEQQGFPPFPSPTSHPLCPLPPPRCHQMPPFPMGVTSQLGSHQAEELLAPCSSQFSWRATEVFELQSKASFWHGKLLKSCPAGLDPARSPNGFPWPGKMLLPGAGANQLPAAKGQWLLQMWPQQ